MFNRLLIANRGEIACRIIRTCQRLGIQTVAVYSDADAFALHVREADQAVYIGPAAAAASYLNGDGIIAAAKMSGADAIHPGYGFLSESASFAEAVESAGLIWVGPRAETIRSMGLKDEAKAIAVAAGVPVLPGYKGSDQSLSRIQAEAEQLGFPLLIKAVAGGGGRGIRLVEHAEALAEALESAVREAEAAFGDGRIMLEKLIRTPRHIEVQVFGDGDGDVVHLYERDCSLQRRRQKVVEEAPAPNMPVAVREAMCAAAVKLANHVNYRGAGTVEFIVDAERDLSSDTFWFLEMNTRLQVEHPVTEMVTGTDLVEWQLRVADGQKLPLSQAQIAISGHAVEARLCAEDPSDNFRPGAGLIERFNPPAVTSGAVVRLESGVASGDKVPPYYDSMLGKLIVFAADRDSAVGELVSVLSGFELVGVPSNIGFLVRCMQSEIFRQGRHHVNWIELSEDEVCRVPEAHQRAALDTAASLLMAQKNWTSWEQNDGFRVNGPSITRARLVIDSEDYFVEPGQSQAAGPHPDSVATELSPGRFAITVGGDSFVVGEPDYQHELEALAGGDVVRAPMPGKVIACAIEAGQAVMRGDPVIIIEAMKMEHTLAAPRDGVVGSIDVELGAQVTEGMALVHLQVNED
ncbi:MAG: acetyl/propionyl/methylcrotonyl-CoA carboxylase subunit alpha [Henriciella sp.]